MAKLTAYEMNCDRCGSVEILREPEFKQSAWQHLSYWKVRPAPIGGSSVTLPTTDGGDLCPTCASELYLWLHPARDEAA